MNTSGEGVRSVPRSFGLRLLLLSAVLATASATGLRAEDAASAAVSKADLDAKLHYCTTCHGVSAQGFRGYYPIPRLAGQQVQYILNQVQAFAEHRRTNNIMFNVAHDLRPELLKALAGAFHEFNPKPLGGAPRELVAAGKKIFEEGNPATDVPPCASCHGPEAKGDGQFPRLAGQLHDYIFNKLTNWRKERGQVPSDTDPQGIMEPIAHGLTEAQIRAVAAYVSYLE